MQWEADHKSAVHIEWDILYSPCDIEYVAMIVYV